ncbi:MAG TPA: hypothetical protein VMB34_16665 [Acetobacteraceae bacterium]|nr:hypothetical protein [Acetobacteraceae bacterium]
MADFFVIARNLLTLEINTVLKDGMSSQKMPDLEDAVIDVMEEYCRFLCQYLPADAPDLPFVATPPDALTPDGLTRLRTIALNLRQQSSTREDIKPILSRIQRNCDQMKDFVIAPVSRAKTLRLPAEQAILLRKIWEIGTETVVMQTVVQIDGDVVTRIQPGHQTTADTALHAAHRQSVEVSFRYWQFLVDTLSRFAGAMVRDLLR